ncbi:hypothetical protein [Labilibaculum sp.]|uniref:hypothetical protein n=1 Tax=Labilibaculum sp. TaxID=2060723 RepID=UPI00356827CF
MFQILLCLFLLFPNGENIQINQPHDFIAVDHLGNVFAVNNSELIKFNPQGEKQSSFSNSMLGRISDIDLNNPLQILIFYSDFNQILFLDRNLAEIGNAIDLYTYSDNETELVCSSPNGGFWIYNSSDKQSVHISDTGKKENQSLFLNSFFEDVLPTKMKEYNSNLYLLYPEQGILHLDQNGQFKKKNFIPGIRNFEITKNTLFYTTEKGIFSWKSLELDDKLLFQSKEYEGEKLILKNNNLYIFNKKTITIKALKL